MKIIKTAHIRALLDPSISDSKVAEELNKIAVEAINAKLEEIENDLDQLVHVSSNENYKKGYEKASSHFKEIISHHEIK